MFPIAQTLAEPFPFLQLTIKVTLLLGLFFALWMAFKHKSASFRHSILAIALISIPCLCAAQWLLPSQSLPWLKQKAVANYEEAFDYSRFQSNELQNSPAPSPAETKPKTDETTTVPHPESSDGPVLALSKQPSGVSFWSLRQILLTIWGCGTAVLLIRFTIAWLVVWQRVRRSPLLCTDGLAPGIKQLIEDFSASSCKFRVHSDPGQMPMCFGVFRHTIVLPADFREWDFADQKSVLLHESAHAHRRDCLVNLLAHIENAILWFHPLSWTLLRCLKSESEMACDDWAIARGADNVKYASALFDVTLSTRRKPTVAIVSVSMADCSPLERRMQSILSTSAPRKPISVMGYFSVASISAIAITCLACFHLDSAASAQDSVPSNTTIEHRIELEDGQIVRGELDGNIKLETSYGSADLELKKIRSVKRLADGRHEVMADDNSVLTGIIRQSQLSLQGLEDREHISVLDFTKITTIGNADLTPEKITDGFLKDGISYHIRAPKDYQPEHEYPAIFFLHDGDSNSRTMVTDFVAMCPKVANRFLLIGINGENRSTKVEGNFNYTYIDFSGRSKYKGFPGTDRQSPALVTESITALKDRIPISKVLLIGEGDGAFLTFSIVMNYPEMIDGTITTNGGLLVQTAPEAYEDEDLIKAQQNTFMTLMHFNPGKDHKKSHIWNAKNAFDEAGYRKKFYQVRDKRAVPQILQREIRRHVEDPDFESKKEGKNE